MNFIINFADQKMNTSPKTYVSEAVETLLDVDAQDPFNLTVWNDEVNTFECVIETLIEVCHHSQEQAEQCTLLIHFKGKCAVKNGSYVDLKPKCDAITDRGIGATLETVNA